MANVLAAQMSNLSIASGQRRVSQNAATTANKVILFLSKNTLWMTPGSFVNTKVCGGEVLASKVQFVFFRR